MVPPLLLLVFKLFVCKALKYDEEYQQALKAFSLACSLDPTWESASQKLEDLVNYLSRMHELVQKKGKVGGKKLQAMLKVGLLFIYFLSKKSYNFSLK